MKIKPAIQKWVEEMQDQYSIEPLIIKRFPKTKNSMDVYVFPLSFGTFEIDAKIVETCVTKPIEDMVDIIAQGSDLMEALSHHDKIEPSDIGLYGWPYYNYTLMNGTPLGNLSPNFEYIGPKSKLISFDEYTGQLCLEVLMIHDYE